MTDRDRADPNGSKPSPDRAEQGVARSNGDEPGSGRSGGGAPAGGKGGDARGPGSDDGDSLGGSEDEASSKGSGDESLLDNGDGGDLGGVADPSAPGTGCGGLTGPGGDGPDLGGGGDGSRSGGGSGDDGVHPGEAGEGGGDEQQPLGRGGVLSGDEIDYLKLIHENFSRECLKSTSYDLRFGDEVFECGRETNTITPLSGEQDPVCVEIEPFGAIVFSTLEVVRTRADTIGRFGLKIGKGLSGLFLQVGPQVEPLYTGPLFGLLMNTSGSPISLRPGEPFLSIEFQYTGEHRHCMPIAKSIGSLRDFMVGDQGVHLADIAAKAPFTTLQGHIDRLERDAEECRNTHDVKLNSRLKKATYAVTKLGVVVAIATLLTMVALWFVRTYILDSGSASDQPEIGEKAQAQEEPGPKLQPVQAGLHERSGRNGAINEAAGGDEEPSVAGGGSEAQAAHGKGHQRPGTAGVGQTSAEKSEQLKHNHSEPARRDKTRAATGPEPEDSGEGKSTNER